MDKRLRTQDQRQNTFDCARLISLCFFFICSLVPTVKAADTTHVYPHEDVLTLRFGGMWQQDQYLSPLLYDGMEVGISNEWWQAFRRAPQWLHMGKADLTFGWLTNPRYTNRLYALDIEAGWGAAYQWDLRFARREQHHLQIFLGPYLAAEWAPRMLLSNVNKPYSMDAAIEVQALAGIRYTFTAPHTAYRLSYILRANIIGMDFMPDYWQSYYELTEGVPGDLRCAGMWNRRYLAHELTLDIISRRSTWRLGIRHEYLEYGKRQMAFSREQVAIVLGTCFRYGVANIR